MDDDGSKEAMAKDRTATAAAALIQKVYRNFRRQRHEQDTENAVEIEQEAIVAANRNDAAQIIQTTYRIYATKKFCIKIVQEMVDHLLQRWYDGHATTIQKSFRGYVTRQKTLDYYKFKEWLKFVGKLLLALFCASIR